MKECRSKIVVSLALGILIGITGISCGGSSQGSGRGDQPAAGACFDAGTRDYSTPGPYNWQRKRAGNFDVYVPEDTPGGCNRFPLVGFAMGTAVPPGFYTTYYETLASWGMMTVVDPSNLLNLGGGSLKNALGAVRKDGNLGGKVSKSGVIGHSQGGAAVVNVALDRNAGIDALVGLMPALFQGGGSIGAAGLYIGATLDQFSVATDPALAYGKTNGPAFIADISGATHTVGAVSRGAVAMTTGWLRCHLADDSNACGLFRQSKRAGSCAFPGNWAKCEGKNF